MCKETANDFKLAAMQPYFMPYVGYWQAISAVDKYILYGNLTFIKDAWMNRNRIRQKNGLVNIITVPLQRKSSNTLINDIQIDNSFKWNEKLLKAILLNYSKAEYFDEIYPLMEQLFTQRYDTLMQLNAQTICDVANFLEIKTEIDYDNSRYLEMEEILKDIEADYSKLPYLEKTRPIRKVARVFEFCRRENSKHFINAIGGRELYDKDEFAQYGIKLEFVETHHIEYNQFGNPFEPNLSIIDVLMHNGKERTQQLLNEYTLV